MSTHPIRKPRTAGELQVNDYVHDALVPFRVLGFEASAAGVTRIIGRIESGTTMRVQHPCDLLLDVTRLVENGTFEGRLRHLMIAKRGA